MTRYQVQYELPVDNPRINVRVLHQGGLLTFYVPLNHPDAHNFGFQDLMNAWALGGKLVVSTPHNMNRDPKYHKDRISKAVSKMPCATSHNSIV